MRKLITTDNARSKPTETDEEETSLVEIGDAAVLTEGQGGGHSEDKRRAYNC
ncbi:albusnodin family lasso peptide [Streptomyces sp. NPDC001777]|uniref:albusnodin family lasso peptide n=1 Tax=Streptomyces sp. NPDC001777 TaxID=3364608 RepID=UPI0036B8680E